MKINKLIFTILTCFAALVSIAQPTNIDDVIKWNFEVKYNDNCEAEIVMTIDQFDGWHIYSQTQPEGAVSLPTEFIFTPSEDYERIGKTKEFGAQFFNHGGIPEKSFHGAQAKFIQKIKLKTGQPFEIKLEYSYMACKESCFPPEYRIKTIQVEGCNAVNNEKSNAPEKTNNAEEKNIQKSNESDESVGTSTTKNGLTQPVRIAVNKASKSGEFYVLPITFKIDKNWALLPLNSTGKSRSSIQIKADDVSEQYIKIEQAEKDKSQLKNESIDLLKGNVKAKLFFKLKKDFDTAKTYAVTMNLAVFNQADSLISVNQKTVEVDVQFSDSSMGLDSGYDSLWIVFFIAFGGGLLALITPCVFPMIPMTVSFFTKQSKTKSEGIKKGIIYAISIVVIYVVLGVIVSATFGSEALNAMSTNVYVNIAFFVLFAIFAISFLGAFEIRLPNSWVNKADSNADKGGLLGIFFMAFTLALVSFSCTGPILGSILVQSATGGIIGPIVAMTGFSLALALPFGLFAAFPGWLNSMPQSGGWLNVVKVVLGLLELAFAFKFLSNADLVVQAHLLERETFLAIWIAIFTVLALYLFGLIRFPHDSPVERLSVGRALFGTATLAFVIYLIPGMWGAPLNGLSGFPPPITYSESPYGIHGKAPEKTNQPKSAENVHGIWTVRNYEEALAWAKEQGKPLMLDFTGWACVNCRKMENNIWTDEDILPLLQDKFVVASLYVDDRTELPKSEQKILPNGKMIKTIGNKYAQMEINRYGKITQPLYVIIDHNENSLSGQASYDTHGEPKLFKEWLEDGLEAFKSSKNITYLKPNFVLLADQQIH